LAAVELAENVSGDERACHLELEAVVDASGWKSLAEGLTGLSVERAGRVGVEVLSGTPSVTDTLGSLRLRRDARAFFQGNRFLIESLVQRVTSLAGAGPIVDLYAGVGLFGLSLAAAGAPGVIAVEGDPVSSLDLEQNAAPFGDRVRVERRSVEQFLALVRDRDEELAGATFILDPPRTGMTREALTGTIAQKPRRIVYLSCDVATFARDTRTLIDAGYELDQLAGVDLFPNTAHVETVALFRR
jgi:23S rRNA (uracil1939-C5)-methyltransferase